jgi:phage anti-repressor protein
MQNFLKKFSDVPNGFIDDFFSISKESYNDKDFTINFEIVIKWLKTRKDNLKKILVSNFEEDYDYILNKIINRNRKIGANSKEILYLTPDCFKELCMISQTAKAKEVRKYYLSLEKLMRKYHEKIEQDLYKELGLLKKNQKPKTQTKKGVIYILKALNSSANVYKIGRTKNLNNRLKNYNSGNANDIEPVFIMETNDIDKVEDCIKILVKDFQYRKFKEVYEIDINILKSAAFRCDELVVGFRKHFEGKNKKISSKKIKEMKEGKDKYFMYLNKN